MTEDSTLYESVSTRALVAMLLREFRADNIIRKKHSCTPRHLSAHPSHLRNNAFSYYVFNIGKFDYLSAPGINVWGF